MVGGQEKVPGPEQDPQFLPPAPLAQLPRGPQLCITPLAHGKRTGISRAGTGAPQPPTPRPPLLSHRGDLLAPPAAPDAREEGGGAAHLTSRGCSHDERQSQESYPQPLRPHAGDRDGQGRAGGPAATPRPPPQCARAGGGAGAGGSCQRPGSPEKSSAPACALLLNIHHKG